MVIRLTGWIGFLLTVAAIYMASLIGYPFMVTITICAALFSLSALIVCEIDSYRGVYSED